MRNVLRAAQEADEFDHYYAFPSTSGGFFKKFDDAINIGLMGWGWGSRMGVDDYYAIC